MHQQIDSTKRGLPELERKVDRASESHLEGIQQRMERVSVMEHALERNVGELESHAGTASAEDVQKLVRLGEQVEKEVTELQHEAAFLTRGGKHTVESTFGAIEEVLISVGDTLKALTKGISNEVTSLRERRSKAAEVAAAQG